MDLRCIRMNRRDPSLTWLEYIVLVSFVNRRFGVHRNDRGDDAKEDSPKSPHSYLAVGLDCRILRKNPMHGDIRSREILRAVISNTLLLRSALVRRRAK